MLSNKHRIAASTVLVAVAMFGVRTAQAAPADVLVGASQTSSCASSHVLVDYDVAYSTDAGGYTVDAVTVTGLGEGCLGADLTVTVTGPNGAPLLELSSPVAAATATLAVPPGTLVRAEAISGVSVVLSN